MRTQREPKGDTPHWAEQPKGEYPLWVPFSQAMGGACRANCQTSVFQQPNRRYNDRTFTGKSRFSAL